VPTNDHQNGDGGPKGLSLGLTADNLRSFAETRVFKSALTVLLLGAILMLSLNADFYTSTMTSAYLSLALFSAVIVLGMIRRAWRDFVWVLAGIILFFVLDYRVMGFKPMLMAWFSFAGLAAFAVLGTRTIWAKGEDPRLLFYGLIPLILFVGSEWMATTLLDITERLHPKTFDLFLYAFDSSLHVQISFWVGQLFWKFQWLRRICVLFYIALPLPLALVYAARLRKSKPQALAAMIAFLVTGPVGVIFYNMMPACGPVHLFGVGFPFHPLSTADALHLPVVPVLIKGARNAIPSLHVAWVLLIWWNSKGCSRWVRAIALSFVWTTVLATLGTGEHYFVDLVVAFPFSLLIQALSSFSLPWRSGIRRIAFLFGALATFTWLALLSFATRLFWISPVIPWTMIVATLFSSTFLWHRLLQATPPELSHSLQPTETAGIAQAYGATG
jgi:PAP2 superfamily